MNRSLALRIGLPILALALIVTPLVLSQQSRQQQQQTTAPDGSRAFTDAKCGTCHYVEPLQLGKKPAEGKANAAPNLPVEGAAYEAEQLEKYLKKEDTLSNGKRHPGAAYKGPEGQLDTLTQWLAALSQPDTTRASQ